MSTKTINTRIGLKYDSYSNWVAVEAEFKPLKGEVVFYEIPSATGEVSQAPAILFKVGDGVNFLKDLPWGSAIAADVYAWAKQQSLLGGTYAPGTEEGAPGTWSFGETNEVITKTREEVAAFVKGETANIAVKVDQVTKANFEEIYDYPYSDEFASRIGKYQTSVSTTGSGAGANWAATGDPFAMQVTNYTANNGVKLESNNFSIQLKTGEGVDSNLEVDGNGLSAKVAEVTYTEEGELTVGDTTGLLDETAVGAIKDYVDAKAAEAQTKSALTVTESGPSGDTLKSYTFTQNGQPLVTVNIPKDFLVRSATINTVTAEDKAEGGKFVNDASFAINDKYIDFVINAKEEEGEASHVYLNVKDLVDAYTVVSTDYIEMAMTNNNITATAKTVTIEAATAGDDETTGNNGLATALDVKNYIADQLEANVPNVIGSAENAVTVTDGDNSKIVSLKLHDVEAADGVEGHVSGLKQSEDGLEIDDQIEWILNCGGAPTTNTPEQE